MKTKEWFNDLDFRREETEVRENKSYALTMAAGGLGMGVITGILIVILQLVVSSHESQQAWIHTVTYAIGALMLAYLVYLLMPLFKDQTISIGSKVVTTLISLGSLIVPFIVGIYLVILMFMLVVGLGTLYLCLKLWLSSSNSSSSSSSYSAPREEYGPERYELDNGAIVTENSFGGGWHGDDGHNYKREIDGTFSRKD